jgi:hypothetical protein
MREIVVHAVERHFTTSGNRSSVEIPDHAAAGIRSSDSPRDAASPSFRSMDAMNAVVELEPTL